MGIGARHEEGCNTLGAHGLTQGLEPQGPGFWRGTLAEILEHGALIIFHSGNPYRSFA